VIGEQVVTDHPEWTGRTVTLICGPPGSGKSTLARQLSSNVVELEAIVADTYPLRLKMFGRACYRIGRNPVASAAVVRGAPTQAERDHHANLCRPARTIVLLTPADICHQRVAERARVEVAKEHGAIDAWWDAWLREHPVPTTRQW
jgi:energy-coupling factor transporter ATP-binding protein EcfA2